MAREGEKEDKGPPTWATLAMGATSGAISRLLTYPADTIKARVQVQGSSPSLTTYSGVFNATGTILRQEGFRGLFRGIGPVLAGAMPGSMAYYWGYELGKQVAPAILPSESGETIADLTTGAVAQMFAGVLFTPLDIVKERLQMHGFLRGSKGRALDVLRDLVLRQGPLGLFRGYWLTNSVWIPWNAIYITGYESVKRGLVSVTGCESPAELPTWSIAFAAATAGGAAAAVTSPLDVVKTRLQVLSTERNAPLTAASVVRDLARTDGALWVLKGMGARVVAIAPGTAISWLMYEGMKASYPI